MIAAMTFSADPGNAHAQNHPVVRRAPHPADAVSGVPHRRAAKIGLGIGGDHQLERKIRVHANFVEYVPMALLMSALLEISGLAAVWLWALGGVLLFARLLHASGLSKKSGYSKGRFYGTLLTWIVLLAMSGMGVGKFLGTL
jgi:uncharacterized protein